MTTLKSEQHHTIPRWLLENFADRDGMLHVVRNSPSASFRSKPGKIFRRRDFYAAKEVGISLEAKVVTRWENLFLPYVKNVLRTARAGIDANDLSGVKPILDDIRACGLFLFHLGYRSPRWLGDDFFSGWGTIQSELEREGQDPSLALGEEVMQLLHTGEFIVVFSQVDTPDFIVGDCGPFVSRDTELGVDNERPRRDDLKWVPAEARIWMALSPHVALGVAARNADATVSVNVLPNSESSATWVDHFNELCARHSSMVAGASETSVATASQLAWAPAC